MFSARPQNLGGRKFSDHREVEVTVRRWLITQNVNLCELEQTDGPRYDRRRLWLGYVDKYSDTSANEDNSFRNHIR
jgi:hypothetical protein